MPRMIVCPECEGRGWFMRECWNTGGMSERTDCGPCNATGTISDRRAPTANDRIVERIKAMQDHLYGGCGVTSAAASGEYNNALDKIRDIILEEAERGE